jgi:hypothetical protein
MYPTKKLTNMYFTSPQLNKEKLQILVWCLLMLHRILANASKFTIEYGMMVERYPNLKEKVGGSIPPAAESPLYLTKNLPSDQLPHVL